MLKLTSTPITLDDLMLDMDQMPIHTVMHIECTDDEAYDFAHKVRETFTLTNSTKCFHFKTDQPNSRTTAITIKRIA